MLDEKVLQGAALEAGRPEARPLWQVNDEPSIHFIFLGDEGAGAVEVFRGRRGAEEEAGEALEHDGAVKRPHGGAQWQCKTPARRAARRAEPCGGRGWR